MAVSNVANSAAYATDGVANTYAIPFYFRQFTDLVVTFKNSLGQVVTLILNTDYTVSGSLDPKLNVYSTGGQIVVSPVLASGGQIRITRVTPRAQPAVYNPQDPFPAGTHEEALDNLELQLQDFLGAFNVVGIADGPPTSWTYPNYSILINSTLVPGGSLGWVLIGGAWYEFCPISGT